MLRILSVALAAWLGGGAIVMSGAHVRYGLTPSVAWLIGALAAAVLARRSLVPLLALVLLLPWLPIRVPPAFLIWTGRAAAVVGILIAAAVAAPRLAPLSGRALHRAVIDPERAPWIAFACAAALSLAAAWSASPQLPQGDEPHYLVITQSLLTDHDLQIENNHRRGDYHAYLSGDLRPDFLRRGANEQIYSIHAPGLPAVIAPAFALFGYPGVMAFLALIAAAASSSAWTAAWRVTGSAAAAWFGWSAVALSEPFFVQTFMVYPDALAGAIVMFAMATALLGRDATIRRLAATGAALALLPWLHTRAVLLAAPLAFVLALRQMETRDLSLGDAAKRVAALVAAPAVSAVAWFAFFAVIYGTPDPRAPYGGAQQMALASVPRGVIGLLFDQQFGLLPAAPVYLFAALGFIPLIRRQPRVAAELAVALAPYAAGVAAFQMWWAGYTTPARFLVPALLPLAIPAAMWFDAVRRTTSRALAFLALAMSLIFTCAVVFVDRGAMILNFRDGTSRLLARLSVVTDITAAVPSMFRSEPRAVLQEGTVWLLAAAAAMAVARIAALQRWSRERQCVAMGAVALVGSMTAATLVWRMNGAAPLTGDGGAIAYLRAYDGDARQIAVSLSPLGTVRRAEVPPRLTLVDARPAAGGPLASLRHVPAATYIVDVTLAHPAGGRITATLDRMLAPTWSFDVDATSAWRRPIVVPVASPALEIDADPALRASIERIAIRPSAVPGSRHRVASGEAAHVARYGRVLMFLFGVHAFMEPGGAWVEGGESAEFAIAADDHQPVRLLVRTPPVGNQVTFDGDGWHQDVALAPGASTIVDVRTPRFTIGVRTGARPIDFEEGNRDDRFLGAWLAPQ